MDLFGPITTPETLNSTRLRLELVRGDNMQPTLMADRDFVLCAPTHGYEGEGIYLVSDPFGWGVYRCEHILGGEIRLSSDNKVYSPRSVDLAEFNEIVLAKVVADVKVRDPRALGRLEGHGRAS